MPVAIAPVNRQARSALGEFPFQGGDQRAVVSIERSLPIELVIVPGHLEHALAWNMPAAQYVFKEWHDVFVPFRPSEGDQQQRVVTRTVAHLLLVWHDVLKSVPYVSDSIPAGTGAAGWSGDPDGGAARRSAICSIP